MSRIHVDPIDFRKRRMQRQGKSDLYALDGFGQMMANLQRDYEWEARRKRSRARHYTRSPTALLFWTETFSLPVGYWPTTIVFLKRGGIDASTTSELVEKPNSGRGGIE